MFQDCMVTVTAPLDIHFWLGGNIRKVLSTRENFAEYEAIPRIP